MKLFSFLGGLLLTASALAQSPAPAAAINQNENAQRARAIINRCIQALGGSAYLNLQSMEETGRAYSFYHNQTEGAGTLFWLFWKAPDRERVELTKQRDIIEIHNGDQGYETTYKGTRAEDRKDHKDYLRNRDHSLRAVLTKWFPDPATALFYDGSTFTENHPVDQVTLLGKNNESVTLYIDQSTHLPVKLSYTIRDPETRDRDQYSEVYDNYQTVDGIPTPLNLTRSKNGETSSQRFLQHVAYNTAMNDSLFQAKVTYDPEAKNSGKH
jgi:hypothetical protein